MVGWVLAVRGKAGEARPIVSEAAHLTRSTDPLGPDWPWLHLLLRARIVLGELEPVQIESTALCERAREAAALGVLSGALLVSADVAFRLGDWEAGGAARDRGDSHRRRNKPAIAPGSCPDEALSPDGSPRV